MKKILKLLKTNIFSLFRLKEHFPFNTLNVYLFFEHGSHFFNGRQTARLRIEKSHIMQIDSLRVNICNLILDFRLLS